jgi:hypothetical protein
LRKGKESIGFCRRWLRRAIAKQLGTIVNHAIVVLVENKKSIV